MTESRKHITVFEHEVLRTDHGSSNRLTLGQLQSLQSFYGEKGTPYFSLVHNGIKFCEYVGVIQIGNLTIEVLPKADKQASDDGTQDKWRKILIDMLKTVGAFDIHAPSSSSLRLRSNSILDLYFELFLKEVDLLVHNGLLKQYRKKEENTNYLKGKLLFSKQLHHNLLHQEKFFVCHTSYDCVHKLHFILFKTIQIIKRINHNADLFSQIGALLLKFPEMPDLIVKEMDFSRIHYNRKTLPYKKAIDIAKLLLLHYHPDLIRGKNDVLALMFDMNKLWEQFVYKCLYQYKDESTSIAAQSHKYFWKPDRGEITKLIPDIVIKIGGHSCYVLDTKWKNLNGHNPSPEDLRQLYAYHVYFDAGKVALIYPGLDNHIKSGLYLDNLGYKNKQCSVITLKVESDINNWKENISNLIFQHLNL